MTPGRRSLSFDHFDQIIPDVERLLGGCTTLGRWSLAQICRHLSASMRGSVDFPESMPNDPSLWVAEELRAQAFESGKLLEGYASPPTFVPAPSETLDERSEAEGLRQAIAYYKASDGPAVPHLYLGPLTKAEWALSSHALRAPSQLRNP